MIVPKIPSVILKVEPTATMPPIAIDIYVNIFIIILTSAHNIMLFYLIVSCLPLTDVFGLLHFYAIRAII